MIYPFLVCERIYKLKPRYSGNCVWYDEPSLIKQVEEHLTKNKVEPTRLTWPDKMTIPENLQRILDGGGYGNLAGEDGDGTDPELLAKLSTLESKVHQVQATEVLLQNNYWKFKRDFIL